MTTEEEFEKWLVEVYRQSRKEQKFKTPNHYGAGIRRIAKALGFPDDYVYRENADLDEIMSLLQNSSDAKPHHLVHLRAFIQFRQYQEEVIAKQLPPLARTTNVFKKQQVESAAVNAVIRHYEELGYSVYSKEKDNLGWDLEAIKEEETLLLEVKGLSGNITSVELTPNEYKNLQEKNSHYKLCIVTSALTNPVLQIFGYNGSCNGWEDDKGERLTIEERIAARFWKG
ncbi:MAG: DUF3883 domain-containing protein [Sphingobacteriales bacterium]|nr:MAG: DUF3883 domain-containing protein [Sphingobacteriales bacterium]